jgi:hypothetical protein
MGLIALRWRGRGLLETMEVIEYSTTLYDKRTVERRIIGLRLSDFGRRCFDTAWERLLNETTDC